MRLDTEEILWFGLLDDLTIGHEDHTVRNLPGETHLPGDAFHRHAVRRRADHGVEDFLTRCSIERRRRLLEQQHLRLLAQRLRGGCGRSAIQAFDFEDPGLKHGQGAGQ